MNKVFFTPGPSELFYTIDGHVKTALRKKIPSISHRSKEFTEIHENAILGLQKLLGLPDDYHIYFTSSATEIWERLTQNCIEKNSFHFVNGAFSDKFYRTVVSLGKNTFEQRVNDGFNPDIKNTAIDDKSELIAVTHNETSTGCMIPSGEIHDLKKRYPEKILAVDAVSSIPYPNFDYSKLDSVYFSVQKGFGLPSGLGVWMLNKNIIEKAKQLENRNNIALSARISTYESNFLKHQTPFTPNILAIYLLSKVCEDLIHKGLDQVRREIDYKAAVLYQAIKDNPHFEPFVKDKKYQSKTIIVGVCEQSSLKLLNFLEQKGIVIGSGYHKYKEKHFRIANFPTHSREQTEKLADLLSEFRF